MSLFDSTLKSSESLFVNEDSLDFEYLPKEIPFRENQQKHIATCIKPLLQDRLGKNLFVSGSPGVGKTAACKFVLRELEEKYSKADIIPIYINCWKKDTSYKIILEICSQIGYRFVHNKKTDDLFAEVSRILKKIPAVFVLDEVDKVQDLQFLYFLLEDIPRKTIVLITNEGEFLSSLDSRIRSRLLPENLEFRPYSLEETMEILKTRRDYAFAKDIFEKDAFDKIVNKTFSLSDIRAGLFLMRESALTAESNSSKKISIDSVDSAVKNLTTFNITVKELDSDEEFILDLISKNQGMSTAKIFNLYRQKSDKSLRTFQRKIKELENANRLIIDEGVESGKKAFFLNLPKKLSDF